MNKLNALGQVHHTTLIECITIRYWGLSSDYFHGPMQKPMSTKKNKTMVHKFSTHIVSHEQSLKHVSDMLRCYIFDLNGSVTYPNHCSFFFPFPKLGYYVCTCFLLNCFFYLLHRDILSMKHRPCITNTFGLHVSLVFRVQLSNTSVKLKRTRQL